MSTRLAIAALAALGLVVFPAGAGAAAVGMNDRETFELVADFYGDPGETNTVTAAVNGTLNGTVVRLNDLTSKIAKDRTPTVGTRFGDYQEAPCTVFTDNSALCLSPLRSGFTAVNVHLGDGNDSFRPGAVTNNFVQNVWGEDGNDNISTGSVTYAQVLGGSGNDVLTLGSSTPQVLFNGSTIPGMWADGESGDDVIYADNGTPDTIDCGDGIDRVASSDAGDTIYGNCEIIG